MKIIVKNLKQVTYNVEIESDQKTVKDLKNEIEKIHGFDSNLMKLLHNGVVLEDSKTLENYNIKNENVVIMMNSKPKKAVSPPISAKTEKKDEQKEKENPKEDNSKNLSEKVSSLVEMGYEKEKVEKALNASGGNIDKAIEYLTSGNIPDASSENHHNQHNLNLGNNGSNNSSNLDPELKKNAILIKILCHNNPNKIVSILNNMKIKNPDILNKIKQHEEEFKNLLVSPITQEDINFYRSFQRDLRSGGRKKIKLTKEESNTIKRLEELGNFSHAEVVQAFIACDKNEELTANYLFEQKLREEEEASKNNKNNNNNDQKQG